jgi:very-short-patch-repair endonuclease
VDQWQFAKGLRKNMTDAEQLLWKHLRAQRLDGQKFRRQQPIGRYIVDFVHFGARLIVEADGGQHNGSDRDEARDAWLKRQGFRILRFWNHEILPQTDAVLTVILDALHASAPNNRPNHEHLSAPLSPRGRGAGGEGEA